MATRKSSSVKKSSSSAPPKKYGEPAKEVKAAAENWQRVNGQDMGRQFYAYNPVRKQTERIATFVLDYAQLSEVIEAAATIKDNLRFLVFLGLRDGYHERETPDDPYFTLYFQVRGDSTKEYANCFQLKWEPGSPFAQTGSQSVYSGLDAIPGASAFLFLHRWLETPAEGILGVFEADSYNLRRRAIGYRFMGEENQRMLDTMRQKNRKSRGALCIHLGRGISVNSHPYEFRPVVEIIEMDKSLTTRLDDGFDGSYYDFSAPIPPN